jgi:hypothetical protein
LKYAEQVVGMNTPEKPPKGLRSSNRFWQDHSDRYDECTCAVDDYRCLLGDAEHYSDFSDYDMPGCGPLIRSAKSIVASFKDGAVWKARNLGALKT